MAKNMSPSLSPFNFSCMAYPLPLLNLFFLHCWAFHLECHLAISSSPMDPRDPSLPSALWGSRGGLSVTQPPDGSGDKKKGETPQIVAVRGSHPWSSSTAAGVSSQCDYGRC